MSTNLPSTEKTTGMQSKNEHRSLRQGQTAEAGRGALGAEGVSGWGVTF